MNTKNKGFTLAELLIVVAITSVLVAISIPIFSSQLEKSREATDLANVRAAYAEIMAEANTGDTNSVYYNAFTKEYNKIVYLKQKKDGWTTKGVLNVGGITSDDPRWKGNVMGDGKCIVAYNMTNQEVTLTWNGLTLRVNYHWSVGDDNRLDASAGSHNDANWPCNAITDFLTATNGTKQQLTTAAITSASPTLQKGISEGYAYQIGYFIVDSDNNIIVNSGRRNITGSKENYTLNVTDYRDNNIKKQFVNTTYESDETYTYKKADDLKSGDNIKIAVQVFKVKDNGNGTAVKMSLEEARELEKLISVENVA